MSSFDDIKCATTAPVQNDQSLTRWLLEQILKEHTT